MDPKDPTIDTQLYLRDGSPRATVCKVQMKDGRIGIGVYRHPETSPELKQDDLDLLAFHRAVDHLPPSLAPQEELEVDDDLQAKLGQKAHDDQKY